MVRESLVGRTMGAAEDAYEAAVAEIERVRVAGEWELVLTSRRYHSLERLPDEVARLIKLQRLTLNRTQISELDALSGLVSLEELWLDETKVHDLSPLSDLKVLEKLWFDYTDVTDVSPLANLDKLTKITMNFSKVGDLRPLRDLPLLASTPTGGIWFASIPALADPRLEHLSKIEDDKVRTRNTLAYLRTLPPWPEPLAGERTEPLRRETHSEAFGQSLTPEVLIESQNLSGWRFSPEHGAMSLYVRNVELDDGQVTLVRMAKDRATTLKTKLAARSNSGGLRQDVFDETGRFTDILADDSRSLSTRSLELWGSLIALGYLLDANDKGAQDGRDPLDLLGAEARSALSTFLGVAAGLVRSFPEARTLDDDHGTFERRTVTIEMVADLIAAALRTSFVDPQSAALIQHVGEIGRREGTQAHKASAVNRTGGMNLIKVAALVAAVPMVAAIGQGVGGDVGAEISSTFQLGELSTDLIKHAIDFFADAGTDIQAFIDTLTPDERAVLNAAFEDAKKNVG